MFRQAPPKGTDWRSELVQDLEAQGLETKPMSAAEVLDTELVLTLFADYCPGQDPAFAWTLLNGYHYPALSNLPVEGRQALAIARLRLPHQISRRAWQQRLPRYQQVPDKFRLYDIDGASLTAFARTRRLELIREALHTPPPRKKRAANYAGAGYYRFYLQRDAHEVEIPGLAAQLATRRVPTPEETPPGTRSPIRIPLTDLVETAEWMEQHAPPGTPASRPWRRIVEDLELHIVDEGGAQPSKELRLDQLLHLVGMVGSGKSTLLTVLTVYLARMGKQVVFVQTDVATLLREFTIFEALAQSDPSLEAVPLIGRSTRLTHLRRLHIAEALRQGASLSREHPAYRMLSTICPLDGLRHDVTAPIPPGGEPCTRLYRIDPHEQEELLDVLAGEDELGTPTSLSAPAPSDRRFDCPMMPVCPVHLSTQRLAAARIWLATPASLLASGPQTPLFPYTLRYIEAVMRTADVVLIDEADLVQVQFDDRFAPMEVLVSRGESWLDRLMNAVSRQVYRSGRPLIGRSPAFDRWLTAHSTTQHAVDRLYTWIRDNSLIRSSLRESYFTRDRLFQHVEFEVERLGLFTAASRQAFAEARELVSRSPVGGGVQQKGILHPWQTATHLELLAVTTLESRSAMRVLDTWLQQTFAWPDARKQERETIGQHLLVALLVGVLDHALQDMLTEWVTVSDVLDLDRGSGSLFYQPDDFLVRLIPEAPMGSVFGFQYYDPQNQGDGELRFFNIRGLGRALLHHLHDALHASEGIPGPHVLLTSGTSWAPGSWRYDVHIPPQAILLPNRRDRTAETRCIFDPLPDPTRPGRRIMVSGLTPDARLLSLRNTVAELTKKFGSRPSLLDQELTQLDEQRQRILLVVGSYHEAMEVGKFLAERRREEGEDDVLILVPDRDDEGSWQRAPGTLVRSLLHSFPTQSARFLVAPLQAIERGHNIVVGQEAAIGSVYFLVRPMPVPGDLHAAIHQVNAWALAYASGLTELDATSAGQQLRTEARKQWEDCLKRTGSYKGLDADERTPLLWTQFILVWQCIGRLLRGGVAARVHFTDAKWAEKTTEGGKDTEATSMLVGFKRILQDAMSDPHPQRQAIAQVLYASAVAAFSHVEGVQYG